MAATLQTMSVDERKQLLMQVWDKLVEVEMQADVGTDDPVPFPCDPSDADISGLDLAEHLVNAGQGGPLAWTCNGAC